MLGYDANKKNNMPSPMRRNQRPPNPLCGHATIRNKLILFTVLPVVLVYSALFVLGVSHTKTHLSANAQNLLAEHAQHQAAHLALAFSQIPALAESLGDLVLAEPDQPQTMLYAHLIDGLRRTPIAQTAAILLYTPSRGAKMTRGSPHGGPLTAAANPTPTPGWRIDGEVIRFNRAITRLGQRLGYTWVELRVADLYATLDRQQSASVTLFVGNDDGLLPPPATADASTQRLARQLPHTRHTDRVATVRDDDGTVYWSIDAQLPGFEWYINAITPKASALAPVTEQIGITVLALSASLLAIILIIGLAARQITRPLTALDGSVRQISRGDFAVAPEVRSNDELGRLADAITRMAGQIADREKLLRNAHQALERRVAERTAALQESNTRLLNQVDETRRTQQALVKASREAQLANRAKSEFLSNMSHELRTPLHGILGYAQILRRDSSFDPVHHESIDAIERCGQHLLHLINDILDLTKIEAGQMTLDLAPVALPRLLRDIELIMAQRAHANGLVLCVELGPALPLWILCDAVKLKQVLLNLVGNAVKFTATGSIVLAARLTTEGQLEFSVSDTGKGIAPDKLDSIFDAFTQVDQGRASDGTGLGLTINQRLIALLGGEPMSVHSTPGQGSRFTFRIPFRQVPEHLRPATQTPTANRPVALNLADKTPCRVMLIDPSQESRKLLAILLKQAGCEVHEHATIADAGQVLADHAFDLVLLDVRLSDGSDQRASAAIQRAARTQPKVVALSANAYPDAAEVARQAGFDAFLAKPFDAAQLLGLLDALLRPSDSSGADTHAWPDALAADTARQVSAAIDQGDVARLFQLAEMLADEPAVPKADIDRIALMARLFDFDGLRRFCATLLARD